jgi:diguanylate cyclase
MTDSPLNDSTISLATAFTLVDEIKRLRAALSEQQAQVEQLGRLTNIDPSLCLPDRRGFQEGVVRAIGRLERYREPGAVVWLAVVNPDRLIAPFGQSRGDAALVRVAGVLQATLRISDVLARLSDNEFGILLPHTDEPRAKKLVGRIREAIAQTELREDNKQQLQARIGVAVIKRFDTAERVIFRAEQSSRGTGTKTEMLISAVY